MVEARWCISIDIEESRENDIMIDEKSWLVDTLVFFELHFGCDSFLAIPDVQIILSNFTGTIFTYLLPYLRSMTV